MSKRRSESLRAFKNDMLVLRFLFWAVTVVWYTRVVKIELESRSVDMFILGIVIWVISLFLLLFLTYVSIVPFKFPQLRRIGERFDPTTCDFITEVIYFASLFMFIGGAVLIMWHCH